MASSDTTDQREARENAVAALITLLLAKHAPDARVTSPIGIPGAFFLDADNRRFFVQVELDEPV